MKKGNFISNNRGITFIEILVSVGIMIVLISILATSLNTIKFNRSIGYQAEAYRLASEELEIVRNLPSASLTNRTNANFTNVFYNQGSWAVTATGTAPSTPNILVLSTSSPAAATGLSAALILPGNGDYGDLDFETRIKINTPVPASFESGLIVRAEDAQNYYRLSLTNNALKFKKIQNGVTTDLWSSVQTFNTNTWYKVKVSASGANFDIYLANVKLGTAVDTSFTSGKIGFFAANNTKISLDSANATVGGVTTMWNFDANAVGGMPAALARFGLYDLSGAQGYLTIENFIAGIDTLKKITIRLTWVENNSTKTIELQTIKNL